MNELWIAVQNLILGRPCLVCHRRVHARDRDTHAKNVHGWKVGRRR